HQVVGSENWRRDGALARHFIPSRSIDQALPEWAYRDEYWRDYLSQPPLSWMLEYWASLVFNASDPVLVGKLLAQTLIAVGVLVSAALLYDVFGFGATLAGLSFLLWGQPFLVWFIDGYYSTTPAMVCQLVLVSWCLRFFARELAGLSPHAARRFPWGDVVAAGCLAYLGALSEWIAVFGNAVAVVAFAIVGAGLHLARSPRAWRAHALTASIAAGSAAGVLTTVVLYGTKVGYAFYWRQLISRVDERTGQTAFWPYTRTLIRQMALSWPRAMLTLLAVMTIVVFAYAIIAAAKDQPGRRRADGVLLLLTMVLGFGGAAAYCYRLRDLVEIHWWFAGTWAIGWAMTICGFAYAAGLVLRRMSAPWSASGPAIVCGVLAAGSVGWNVSFVELVPSRLSHDITGNRADLYRALGRSMPRDGYPLLVADLPDLFGDYPFTTAYLRRPLLRYNAAGDPHNRSGDLFVKLGTTEDATPDLLQRYQSVNDVVYVAYDGGIRQCAFDAVTLGPLPGAPALRMCRVPATSLLRDPGGLWSTSLSTTDVTVDPRAQTFSVKVSAPAAWTWSAVSDNPFIALTSPGRVTGPGTATFSVSANPGSPRQSSVTIGGQQVRVTQRGATGAEDCVRDIDVQETWRAVWGVRTTQATVHAPPNCAWSAASSVPWIRVSARDGVGDGQFGYEVTKNVEAAQRTGRVSVGGKTTTVVVLGCPYDISTIAVHAGAKGETVRLAVTGECTWIWTAVSGDPFLTITSGASAAGPGVVIVDVAPNPEGHREGRLTIAGYTVSIVQAGR
ncbi:MAG TPA: BACON domain-containing protein, partial [Vicinamibacterales bacterium]|nr:BACON domain-containing protein [Vicinamibacterales bacterium]